MLIFSALADPTRLSIVEMLGASGHLSSTAISDHFPISPPAISQHLKVLREAGLVQVETRAQQRIYRINPEGIVEMEHWVSQMRRIWEQRLDALDGVLQEEMRKMKKPTPRRRK